MRFECEASELRSVLKAPAGAVSRKNVLPVLSGLLLQASGGTLSVTGSDMESWVTARASVKVVQHGESVLPAQLFKDIVNRLEGRVVVEASDGRVLVVAGRAKFSLNSLPVDQFPRPPAGAEPVAEVAGLERVLFAVSRDDTCPILTGVCFDNGTLVATDGVRLARFKGYPFEGKAVVPASALVPLVREESVRLAIQDRTATFKADGLEVVARLLDGSFPSYERILPADYPFEVVVDRQQLVSALERLEVIHNIVRVNLYDDGLVLEATNSEVGTAREVVEPKFRSGGDLEVVFQAQYLLDGLRVVRGEDASLSFTGPETPAAIEEGGYLYIVLPMKPVATS